MESVAVRGVLVVGTGVVTGQVPKFSAVGDTEAAAPPKDTVLDHAEVTTPLVQ